MSAVKQALIIAAGNGSRLQPASGQIPKPLTPVCGIPLIKRLLHQMHKAGIEDCVIVLGYQGENLRRSLEEARDLPPVTLQWVMNEDWKLANGVSVLKAKDLLRDDFVLLMADHLFQSATLARLLRRRPSPGEVILAVDRKIDRIYDIDDATKVKVNGTQILAIGKDLKDFNAVDTGMFLCTTEIFTALEAARDNGNCSLSDGMKKLIADGKLRFFDIKDGWWLDVDTPAALRQAERNLFEQLKVADEGWVVRTINRPLATRLLQFLMDQPVTPSMLYTGALFFGILAAGLFAHGAYISVLLGVLFFQALMVLNLATAGFERLLLHPTNHEEGLGAWTERMLYLVFLLGLTFGFYRQQGENFILLLGGLTLFDAFLAIYVADKSVPASNAAANKMQLRDGEKSEILPKSPGLPGPVEKLLQFGSIFVRPQAVIFFAAILALFGRLSWIFWMTFLGTHLAALTLFYTKKNQPVADSERLVS